MGLRFRRSVKICKGVRVNLGKTGASVSLGTRGAHYTVNTNGRKTASVGLPGTGLYYSESVGGRKRNYNSSAYTKRQSIQQQKIALQQQKADETRKNALLVQEYDNYVDVIRNVHRECDEPIDWYNISQMPEPFPYGWKGEHEQIAEKAYNDFKPNIFEKIITSSGEKRKQQLFANIEKGRNEDLQAYANWKMMHEFSNRIIQGDTDAYLDAINEANPFEDLVQYGSDFEFGTDDKNVMEIEFKVKSDATIPHISLSLTSTGKLTKKDLTKTQYYDYTQDYVCSCSIRLAREIFAILPVQYVIVHAVDNVVNTATGNKEDCTILSVKFNRNGFQNINFNAIDASDFVETFEYSMKFLKTSGFKPVKRL